MSDLTDRYRDTLDIREQIARIDRNQAEIEKLFAKARKFKREPWFILIGALAAGAVARLPEILHAFGLAT